MELRKHIKRILCKYLIEQNITNSDNLSRIEKKRLLIQNKPIIVYRGISDSGVNFYTGKKELPFTYYSLTKEKAEKYGNLNIYIFNKNSQQIKLFYAKDLFDKFGTSEIEEKVVIDTLIKEGYSAALIKGDELVVFDKALITKTTKGYLNENSEQKIIAYHGSNALFDEFSAEKIGANSDVNSTRNLYKDKYGFFFTSDFEEAKSSANAVAKQKGGKPIVYTCELIFSNPYTWSDLKKDIGDGGIQKIYDKTDGIGWGVFDSNRNFIIKRCLELKKDSILFNSHGIKFIVVFSTSQIKIINSETFEIKYSFRDKR